MFLPIGDTTVIDHIFEELEADDRVSEVFVSTNERFADAFDSHLEAAPYEKPTLTVEETTEEDEKFGVVGALEQLVARERITEDTLVVAGDNVISFDLSSFLDDFQARSQPTLAAYDVGSYDRAKSYGLVNLDGDRIVDFQEKPDDPRSTLVSIACYAFTAEAIGLLSTYLEDGNNPDEPGWFIQWLQSRLPVYAYSFDDAWFDIGTAESYLDAVAWQLDGENIVADSALVENSRLGENVHVMPGAEVRDSRVDDSIIFADVTVTDSDLQSSILDESCQVENVELSGALVGPYSLIEN